MAVVPSGSITNLYAHYVAGDADGTWYEADHWEEKWNADYNCPCWYNTETGEMVWTLSRTGSEVRHGSSSWFLPDDAANPPLMIGDAKPEGAEQQPTEEQPEHKWDWGQHWSEQCNKTVYYNLATKHIVFSEDSLEPLEFKEGSEMFDFDDLPAFDSTQQDAVLALEDRPDSAEAERNGGEGSGAPGRAPREEPEAKPSLHSSAEPTAAAERKMRSPRVHEARACTERAEIGVCGLADMDRVAELDREASDKRSPSTGCCATTGCFKIIKDFTRKRSEQGSPSKQSSFADEAECESLHLRRREQELPRAPMPSPSRLDAGCNGEPRESGAIAERGVVVSRSGRTQEDRSCASARDVEKVDARRKAPRAPVAAAAAATPTRASATAGASLAEAAAEDHAVEADCREARTCDECGVFTAEGAPGDNQFGDRWYCGNCWRRYVGPMETARVLQRARVLARAKRNSPPVPPTPSTPSLQAKDNPQPVPPTPSTPSWQGGTPLRSEVSSPEVVTVASSPASPELAAEASGPEVVAAASGPEAVGEASGPEAVCEASGPEVAAQGSGLEQEEGEKAHRFRVPKLPSLQSRLMGQVALPPSPLGMLLQSSRSSARKLRSSGRLVEADAGDYEQVRGAGNELARMLSDRLVRTGEVKASPAGEADEELAQGRAWRRGRAEERPLRREAAEMGA